MASQLFMMFAPLEGWREVRSRPPRAIDYAQVLKELSDVHFPTPNKSCWFKTISAAQAASLYAAFPADEARAS